MSTRPAPDRRNKMPAPKVNQLDINSGFAYPASVPDDADDRVDDRNGKDQRARTSDGRQLREDDASARPRRQCR